MNPYLLKQGCKADFLVLEIKVINGSVHGAICHGGFFQELINNQVYTSMFPQCTC
jgi:hypothetical protein